MTTGWSLVALVHVAGLALGMGAATVKLALLLGCRADDFVPTYLRVVKVLTRFIVSGLALLTLSGAAWLAMGYPLTPLLVAKLACVAALWAIGPVIDKAVEPAFVRLAPRAGETATPEFARARGRYLAFEAAGTGLFWIVAALGVLL